MYTLTRLWSPAAWSLSPAESRLSSGSHWPPSCHSARSTGSLVRWLWEETCVEKPFLSLSHADAALFTHS